ncbi:MAG: hypothetical protein HDR20_08370 [Lachnospiraceae bacterium]|nr:hypothetical protein [Lachnospiraceae bacterium]
MINRKKALLFCLYFLLAQVILNVGLGKTYAMEALDEKISQAMEESNPKQYEMNVILMDLGIKNWRCPHFESDEIWESDEPLGEYSPEKLQEYTDRDLEVKIDYGFGHIKEAKHEEFIQSVRIYEQGELISCSCNIWSVGFVVDGGTRLKYPKILQ